jgi:hypothetical protein
MANNNAKSRGGKLGQQHAKQGKPARPPAIGVFDYNRQVNAAYMENYNKNKKK